MILGVYWSYAFPEKVYKYKYFKFSEARGGFDDRPARLEAIISTLNAEEIISLIRELHLKYEECPIYIYRERNKLKIWTTNYEMYDYDFLLFKEIDKILEKKSFVHSTKNFFNDLDRENIIVLRKETVMLDTYQTGNIKIFHSSRDKHESVLKSINIQCYLKSVVKQDFVNELKQITLSENFTFMYHFEYIKGDLTNLHVVISNGRQGLELKSKNETDIASFKSKTTSIFEKYNISFEHVEGFNMDKHSGVTIEIIEEQERDFLIGSYMKIKKNSS